MTGFAHVLVVGAGQMGAGIAQVLAASGRRVSLHDSVPGAAERALGAVGRGLGRTGAGGGAEPRSVLARIAPVDELVPAELLIEAIVEDEAAKRELLARAEAVLSPEAILCSNTSSVSITALAGGAVRPERIVGMHFFNPAPVMRLVEVVRGLETSSATVAAVTALARDLGKTAIESRDLPGFVSNRILMPLINEAAWALLEGVADAEAIDTVARLGFNHPMGPLALADLIGLDTCVAIMEVMHAGLGNPRFAPCPLLRQYVQAGRLGRKSGRGFHVYG